MIPVPGFEGRRVAVFGLGRSGITAARALHAGGAIPILWDDGVSGRMQAEAEGFTVEDRLSVALQGPGHGRKEVDGDSRQSEENADDWEAGESHGCSRRETCGSGF